MEPYETVSLDDTIRLMRAGFVVCTNQKGRADRQIIRATDPTEYYYITVMTYGCLHNLGVCDVALNLPGSTTTGTYIALESAFTPE